MALRVLLQCLYYPPEVGGLESHVAGLAEGLARRGHYVDMLTSRSQPGTASKEKLGGVNVRRVWMPGKHAFGWAAHTAVTLPVHRRLARKADIVHAHTFASALPATLAPRARRRPLVVTLHTSHFLMRASSPRWRRIFARIIAAADYLLATSEEILLVALEIHPHPRVEVMTNAVDTDRFAPGEGRAGEGRFRIVVPRRLYPKNGVEFFVRAMPLIAERLDIEARIVGDGPERERLKSLAIELDVSDRIEFLGARPNDEMPALLKNADIAVIPSLMEATSIAALEAMACALPVAASRVGGLPEIVDEGVGALVEPKNPRALANAVVSLLTRPDRGELGREARRRVVASWSISRMVERHLEIYNGLLDEAKERSSSG